MTVTAAGPNANLLSKISFAHGKANIDTLSKEQANELLTVLARDSLTSGGNIKSGYFRVLTDKNGHITEIGRSSVRSKGRAAATDLIKALTEKACGADSAAMDALNDYLDKSGQKVGSKSLVKLVGARAAQAEGSPQAGALLEDSSPLVENERGDALARYMQRIGGRLNDDSTGRLRLHGGQGRSSAQPSANPRTSSAEGEDGNPISESSAPLAARMLAIIKEIPAPEPDFDEIHKEYVDAWKSTGSESHLEPREALPEWCRELKFPINLLAIKDLHRSLVEYEPGKLRYVMRDHDDDNPDSKKISQNNQDKAIALNSFMEEWQTALGEREAQNLSRNLTRFASQASFMIFLTRQQRIQTVVSQHPLDGAEFWLSYPNFSAPISFAVESLDDGKNLLFTFINDSDPVVAKRSGGLDETTVVPLSQVWKSGVSFTVPVDALTREDFDPSCLKIVSASWGLTDPD